jgi:hypothetical protein
VRVLKAVVLPALFVAGLARGEDFTGEIYLLGSSVADNGTSGALPSRLYTATQFLDFPGDFGDAKTFRMEMATLPVFGDLSQTLDGALGYALDSRTHMSLFGQVTSTPDLQFLPLLQGTYEDRLNNPGFRPEAPCLGCEGRMNMVYLVSLNFMRKYDWEVPRLDISSRPIPIQFSAGITAKYYWEEIWDDDYTAQNMNMDAGACVKFLWGYDPVRKSSDRDFKVQFSGFEILPTTQRSDFGGIQVYEEMTYRWRMSVSWEEGFPSLGSTLSGGFTQKSEGGAIPGFGAEWDLKEMLFVRAGIDDDYISAGASLAWRWASVHYAFRYHELGTSLYQVSGQVAWR